MAELAKRIFSLGELSPDFYGATSLDQYQAGLRTCRNFFVNRFSGVINRSGTRFISNVHSSDNPVRIIPFVSNDITLIIELGHNYIRFFRNDVAFGGVITTSARVYDSQHLFEINYQQIGNDLILVHKNYEPNRLRYNPTDDTITGAAFPLIPETKAPTNLIREGTDEGTNNYSYWVTTVDETTLEESLPSKIDLMSTISADGLSRVSFIEIRWTRNPKAIQYNIYRSTSSNDFGFFYAVVGKDNRVSTVEGAEGYDTIFFRDFGLSLERRTDSTPQRSQPFSGTGEGHYPGVIGVHQQRLILASTQDNQNELALSKTGLINNFSDSYPILDDDSIKVKLASGDNIHAFASSDRLIMFTDKEEVLIDGDDAGILSPTNNINLRTLSDWGSISLRPITVGHLILYVQSQGVYIRSLNTRNVYTSDFINRYGIHLFRNNTIVDWTYAKSPHSNIWIVNDKSELICLTVSISDGFVGTSRHDFEGATVESVLTIPVDNEDTVYFVINRDGTRSIERLSKRIQDDEDDYAFVDSHVFADVSDSLNGELQITNEFSDSHGWDAGVELTLVFPFNISTYNTDTTHNGFISVGTTITFTHNNITYVLKANRESTSANAIHVISSLDIPSALQTTPFTIDYNMAHVNFKGLEHLNGKEVSIYANSSVIASANNPSYLTYRVTNGRLSRDLPRAFTKVAIGLPYTCDLETLDVDSRGISTTLNQNKLIKEVGVYTQSTRGLFAGNDLTDDDSVDNLREFKTSSKGVLNGILKNSFETDYKDIKIQSSWNRNGRVVIRGVDPLPATVLSIYPLGFFPRTTENIQQPERKRVEE